MNFYSTTIFFTFITLNYCPHTNSKNFSNIFEPDNYSAVSKAFNDVVDVFMGQKNIEYSILVIKEGLSERSNGVFQNLIAKNNGKFDYYINSIETMICEDVIFDSHLIIFVNTTIENIMCYQKYFQLRRPESVTKAIIYMDNLSQENFGRTGFKLRKLNLFRNQIFTQTYFVVNEVNHVILMTFEWFSSSFCNKAHISIQNVFDKSSEEWNKKLQKQDKFMEYYGCELVLFTPTRRLPLSIHNWGYALVNSLHTNFTVHGIVPEVFRIASKKFNFKADYQPIVVRTKKSFLHDLDMTHNHIVHINGTYKEPNVYFEVSAKTSIYGTRVISTYPFLESIMYLVVTPAEEYTPYEKLLLPFDEETWVLLVITFTLAFFAIFIINKLSRKVQNVFYGSRVKTPLLNLISIFFGISQTQLPSGNFSRQILILFVYFCLIFRTCFQSKMFEFMTSHPRHSPPKTIQDLVERNYTIYTEYKYIFEEIFSDEISILPKIQELTFDQFFIIYSTQSRNSSANCALEIQNIYRINQMAWNRQNDGWMRLNNENILVLHGAFGMISYSFYFNMISKIVDNLRDTGILKYLVEKQVKEMPKILKHADDPKILTLNKLEFGFNIWLGFSVISIVCFVIEVLILKIRIFCRRLMSKKCVKYAKVRPERVKRVYKEEYLRVNVARFKKFRVQKTKPISKVQCSDIKAKDNNLAVENEIVESSPLEKLLDHKTANYDDIMRRIDDIFD